MHSVPIRRSRLMFGLLSAALAIVATTAVVAAARAGTPGSADDARSSPVSVAGPIGSTSAGGFSSSAMATVTPSAPQPTPYDTATSPCRSTASACVDLAAKKAWLQRGGSVVRGPVPIEDGQPGHETPTGTFHVAWKAAYTVSTIYGIPMPHAVFFAAGGIAFHEGPLDSPSHGCVHLSAADASAFFDALNQGDEVDVW